ncbi:FHA domain-containing protein, partial [Planctomycetaceae bacterium]|nr:FHA domain-containing protein [Planctomycetaceae bacterium]
MSLLLVKSPNYVLQRFELSKNQPLSIGSHSISDIQLDDEGVALIEARISWSKKQFDITSAGDQGILVNGNKVNSAGLTSGDRFVIGSTQFLFTTESDAKQLGEDPFENKSDDKYIRPSDEIAGEDYRRARHFLHRLGQKLPVHPTVTQQTDRLKSQMQQVLNDARSASR